MPTGGLRWLARRDSPPVSILVAAVVRVGPWQTALRSRVRRLRPRCRLITIRLFVLESVIVVAIPVIAAVMPATVVLGGPCTGLHGGLWNGLRAGLCRGCFRAGSVPDLGTGSRPSGVVRGGLHSGRLAQCYEASLRTRGVHADTPRLGGQLSERVGIAAAVRLGHARVQRGLILQLSKPRLLRVADVLQRRGDRSGHAEPLRFRLVAPELQVEAVLRAERPHHASP
mmetsp:Transcript_45688/g.118185  ORF Transcript_45688/g.118185 Transcript_45688/m.118185 type:complete len:227 (+) Transcript_45688:318-998(+)